MIPAGYMAKRIATRPEWLKADGLVDVYSVSHCVSRDFADYIPYWKHNGWWFFDSPDVILALARDQSLDLTGTQLFYYEVHEREYDAVAGSWKPFAPESSFVTRVQAPMTRRLEGFDVVAFEGHTAPECSPLSCNYLATTVEINEHCLLASCEQAIALLEEGRFNDTEPGPFRVFAVYSGPWPAPPIGRAPVLTP
jgi:hypothetical protein